MKIAFLSFYSGEIFRGVETYVHCLANELVKLGHEVTVYQNGPKLKNSKYRTVSIGMDIDWEETGIYWKKFVKDFTQIVLSKVDKDTDILIPTNGGWQSFLCKLWTMKHGKKLIISGQAGIGIDDIINLWCFPDTFVALTGYQKNWTKKANPLVKTVTIPNGVDISLFSKTKEKIKFDLPKPIILSVGALVPIKRHELEIEAVSKLKTGSLVISGKGQSEEKLKKLGEEKLKGRFQIIHLPHDQIPNLYHSADLFTFATSPWESFGIVLVEAMAAGLPIVASDDPIRREIVGDAGLFIDPNDSGAYAKTIEKALSIDWGDKPRNQAKKFGWDRIAKEYEQLFKELLQ
jgi:glycosyltransferase involved in cell wall biosynthesis